MAPQVAAVKVAPAAAAAQPDAATMSARDRIRLHVQKNLQMQQQQQAQQQAQQQRAGGASAGVKKANAVESLQTKAAPSRKRPHDDTRSNGDGSPTWETNTPPSGVPIEESELAPKRSRRQGLDGCGPGGSDGEDGDEYGDNVDDMPSPSPQQGMMAPGIDSSLNLSLEMSGGSIFQHSNDDGHADEERVQVLGRAESGGVPSPGEQAAAGFDSPPCEVSWNGAEAPVEATVEPVAGPEGHVDDDWVKGLYDMEGLFDLCSGY
mmetsp:Transcript_265/g.595  ORF Transcript_265/g.595 Transcript_265/m.595 type:complete len:263 (+) Transcript_265:292-1080(+)|eukprot:CAMPEP_0173398418 /NCGR_PEP_ID=MMETSP1356-20130122/41512_1 /TAXON_ID=77927 ORGANISM="Hemiselmis virescens, Strain PCC157" /NCGR_SAMPLE_ID=MMETSP1356 /ASSEMBLY_ACC=CAM_ASM_000847 /LENGTH=262 /DNA_ID=CAMNT_0014357897 /DNA_START=197 /DNA_END=985 /DNA_ORIENTATION=-